MVLFKSSFNPAGFLMSDAMLTMLRLRIMCRSNNHVERGIYRRVGWDGYRVGAKPLRARSMACFGV